MPDFPKVISARYGVPNSWTLAVAEQHGAYAEARRAFTSLSPEQIGAEVKDANMRGRGGAGFPTGVKWGFLPKDKSKPVYLVINADEGEPGTFKDRTLMELDPHRLVEGCLITMRAIGAHTCYIYIRCELVTSIKRVEAAIEEARAKGYVGKTPFGVDHPTAIWVHTGAGAYICGEETSLLNSLEGLRGEPRLKPPFPAVSGAFGCPTIVNNVESIASVPDIVRMTGKAWAAQSRLPNDGGTRLYGVSGHVKTPGVYEAPVGLTLRELIYDLGGGMLHEGRPLKAVIPGGSSTPVLRPDELIHAPDPKHPLNAWHGKSPIDVPMGVDTFRALGTMLGTCCAIVMDDSVNMVQVARNLMHFYAHESCGQCTPCREGTGWLHDILNGLVEGRGKPSDVALLVEVANNMMGNTICAFADGTAMPMLGFLQRFRDEFDAASQQGGIKARTLGVTSQPLVLGGRS
jgi:NADH-quinone oxidoreductase subunit F